ncbi:MAG: ATP-binding cassette domain-containing protein [Polyangiaceae bacterium]|jgi:ABC-type Fe3+/spermidine/putrescine transport system ATPase subunit
MTRIEHVTCRFGDFSLDDISLAVGEREYWVLLGPSGSGKSLLLETIAGFHTPDRGRVLVEGRDVTDVPPERRGIGIVFQHAALFPHYTVSANIEYGLRVRGVPRKERERAAGALIERLGLQRVLSRPVSALSGGEAQRVAIARTLAVKPALLLLDEPLSMVDHGARLELQTQLRSIVSELGIRTLHVTHSREEATALGNHFAIILGGRIVQHGTADSLRARPRCPFVARFLGLDPAEAAQPCEEACLQRPGSCKSLD